MRRAPDLVGVPAELRLQRARLRAEVLTLADRLGQLELELEERHRRTAHDRLGGATGVGRDAVGCELQDEADELAMELARARLALVAVEEEIAVLAARAAQAAAERPAPQVRASA